VKGYVTNLRACPDGTPVTAEYVIGAYHQLFQIEKSFRMAKSDLQARPIYHYKRDPIEAHLTIVFAALAVSRWIEARTGWSIRKFVRTARRYKPSKSRPEPTSALPLTLPDDLRAGLDRIHHDLSAHKLERSQGLTSTMDHHGGDSCSRSRTWPSRFVYVPSV
jgi:hypothetical protein